jgi:4-amino-4-deoxy-L-arabinose transferase-like glycosyltransferase
MVSPISASVEPSEPPDAARFPRWLLPVLLLGFAAVLFVRLGDAPVHRTAEVRVDRVSRHMLESGDWLVPRLGEKVRLQKPPLYYWMATAVESAAGEAANVWLRTPAALSALGLLLVAWGWGRWVGGARQGLLAALLLVGLVGVAEFGRLGVAETLLAASSSAALLAYEHARATGSRRALWACLIALAAAVLAKATPVLLTVALPIALDLALLRRLKPALNRRTLGLAALTLVPALLWYVAVIATVPGAWDSIVSFALLPFGVRLPEAAGNASHVRPVWYHVVALVTMGLPLLALLPLVVARAWRTRGWRDAPRLRFAALAVAAPLLGFSLIPEKQDHYLLPIMPAWAVLLADALLDACARAAAGARGLRVASLVTAALLLVAAGAFALALRWGFDLSWPLALGLVAAVGLAAAVVLESGWRGRALPWAAGLAGATLLLMLVWFATFDVVKQRLEAGVATEAELAHWHAVRDAHPVFGRSLPEPDPPDDADN